MKKLNLVDNINKSNAITHNGKFHIDEVFSTVLLMNLFDEIRLIRVSNIPDNTEIKDKIIYDIGKGEFDHHQPNPLTRKDGIKYSSFGLLWRKYGKKYLEKINCQDIDFAWDSFDATLVKTIDKIDNFQIETDCLKNYLISNIIERFNPNWNSDTDSNTKFQEAVSFASVIFDNEINNVLSIIDAKRYLKNNIVIDKNYIILDKSIPYNDFINENDTENKIKFIICPSKRNGYEIRTVLNRAIFPNEWYGISEEEFRKKYNISGFLYCHSNGKLCITNSLETAVKIIDLT